MHIDSLRCINTARIDTSGGDLSVESLDGGAVIRSGGGGVKVGTVAGCSRRGRGVFEVICGDFRESGTWSRGDRGRDRAAYTRFILGL